MSSSSNIYFEHIRSGNPQLRALWMCVLVVCVMSSPDEYLASDTVSVNTVDIEKEFQAEGAAERERLRELGKLLRQLHVAYLFCRSDKSKVSTASYEAWKTIVKKVGSTPGHWRELGFFLGIDKEDLDYIENYAPSRDKTDLVLRVCAEGEEGVEGREATTLATVADALLSMERYDVLKALEPSLLELNQLICKRSGSSSDAGYHSNENEPSIFKPQNIFNDLPDALRSSYVPQLKQRPEVPRDPVESPLKKYTGIEDDKPTVFLTFVEDGIEFAENIRNRIGSWSEEIAVQTLTLNDRRNEVFQNPQNVINDFIDKADYTIPIVTEGYMRCVAGKAGGAEGDGEEARAGGGRVDVRYARYVYTQLTHRYTFSEGCCNRRVRCVVPRAVDRTLLARLYKYPVLMPWTCEVDFDLMFKDLLKKVRK